MRSTVRGLPLGCDYFASLPGAQRQEVFTKLVLTEVVRGPRGILGWSPPSLILFFLETGSLTDTSLKLTT